MSLLRVAPVLLFTHSLLLLACADGVNDQGETADAGTDETGDAGTDETGDAGTDETGDGNSEVLETCETLCLDSDYAICSAMEPSFDPDMCAAVCVSIFMEIETECTTECYDAYLALYKCLGAASTGDLDPATCEVVTQFCAEPSGQQATACGDCSVG